MDVMKEIQLDVISCVMDNETLVQKSQIQDFNTKSQLIVNEAQEALFYKDGQALDLFGPGKHSLNTDNLPFLKRIFGKFFGGKTPFPCEVFFINKVTIMDIPWGIGKDPIVLEDPLYHIIVGVKANGQTGIVVKDSRRFVLKVVGQLPVFDVESVRKIIKTMMIASVKEAIAKTIVEKRVSILEISTKLSELASEIRQHLNESLEDLGLAATHLHIPTIFAEDSDLAKLRQAKEKRMELMNDAELEAYKIQVLSEARAKARAAEGYTYQDERKYDVLESAANNSGTGGTLINAGLGLGVGLGVMNEVGKVTSASMNPQQPQQPQQQAQGATRTCPTCAATLPATAKFCSNCGATMPAEVKAAAKFCPECGFKLEGPTKFCPECGNKIQ